MTVKEISKIRRLIESFLRERRLRDAIDTLKKVTHNAMLFELTDRVGRIEQTYFYLLSYLTQGSDDPHRDKVLNDIVAQCYDVLDSFVAIASEQEVSTSYYNNRRNKRQQKGKAAIERSVQNWQNARIRAASLSSLFAEAAEKNHDSKRELENNEYSLFNSIWASYPLKKDERQIIVDLILDEEISTAQAIHLTSALGLATLEFPDTETLIALCDIYTATCAQSSERHERVSAAAVIFIVMSLYRFHGRTLSNALRVRLEALNDLPSWRGDLRNTFLELVRSRDTERITRTMTNEIIPGMMSLKPEIEKKMRDMQVDPDAELLATDNPEWESLLHNSKLGDKIKELNEMQMEGADVFMSAFSHLKNFPFFFEPMNWFSPFSKENAKIEPILTQNPEMIEIASLVEGMPFLCDSDKFSMFFSVSMGPQLQRSAFMNMIMENREHLEEVKSQIKALTDVDSRRRHIRNFIHNYYRFVNLFRRKEEFFNIFTTKINLLKVDALKETLEDAELLKLIGEFYFRHKYYEDSLTAFTILDEMGEFDGTLYQKMGYASEKLGRTANALGFYEQADLLGGTSTWLKKRLVAVYRASGRIQDALNILNDLANDFHEDAEIALLCGYTYIDADNYREALKHFFKAEFLKPGDARFIRPIAWSLFMVHDFERASQYYDKLLMLKPTPEDYLNMGHVALAKSNIKEAINYYKIYISDQQNDKDMFYKSIENDMSYLVRAGITKNMISLVADAMFYDFDRHARH